MSKEFFTVPQVAERLQVNRHKVLRWIASGELVAADLSQNRVERPRYRIADDELARFVKSRQSAPAVSTPKQSRTKPVSVREFVH